MTLEVTSQTLAKRSWIKISQIRTLSVERIGRRLAVVPSEEMTAVVEGLNEIIGAGQRGQASLIA